MFICLKSWPRAFTKFSKGSQRGQQVSIKPPLPYGEEALVQTEDRHYCHCLLLEQTGAECSGDGGAWGRRRSYENPWREKLATPLIIHGFVEHPICYITASVFSYGNFPHFINIPPKTVWKLIMQFHYIWMKRNHGGRGVVMIYLLAYTSSGQLCGRSGSSFTFNQLNTEIVLHVRTWSCGILLSVRLLKPS